jgi:hypothetical protein
VVVLGPAVRARVSRRSLLAVPRNDERLIQEFQRYRSVDGLETVRATIAAEFAPHQRTAALYMAFCPPFETLPRVEANSSAGPPATIKLVQSLHNGAQIEVRLAQGRDREETVTVRLVATAATDVA